jgi:DNA invertase Pin-like site-specific DNA recombinase
MKSSSFVTAVSYRTLTNTNESIRTSKLHSNNHYFARKGICIVKSFTDMSSYFEESERVGFTEMIEFMKKNEIKLVIIEKQSDLSEVPNIGCALEEIIGECNAKIFYLDLNNK